MTSSNTLPQGWTVPEEGSRDAVLHGLTQEHLSDETFD